ncbi:hypothetical protein COV19_02140 [Candidatus Woesearchaeota archaeon CG10_big_fil_rev_8_21_14_0_10_44_13]|nr:MAG: hypothetical protein COV19_02140 [Candidatus Woesearchaeota archaeon CG10_big_fil_rev_8_21_14_0_10_44_13]
MAKAKKSKKKVVKKAGKAGKPKKVKHAAKASSKRSGKSAVKDLSHIRKCPACGSDNVVYVPKDDNIVCNDCGEIFARLTPEEEKKYEKVSDVI